MLILFDKSFVDSSLKTRLSRQHDQIERWVIRACRLISEKLYRFSVLVFRLKERLRKALIKQQEFNGSFEIIGLSHSGNSKDKTIDQNIAEKGGIYSHADGKVHYTKQSYLDGIKQAGCHIKDYK